MKKLINIIIILILGYFIYTSPSRAQDLSHTLPNDIVFTTSDSDPEILLPPNRNVLVLVSADTLEYTELYRDETADEVRAISWSPQGDLLAVWHVDFEETTTRICIVTMAGIRHICFDDTPNLPRYTPPLPEAFTLTWSEDGEKVYLVVEHEDELHFVERDVDTGHTLRTLYRRSFEEDIWKRSAVVWTPNLRFVAMSYDYPEEGGVLIDLDTGTEIVLPTVIAPSLEEFRKAPEHFGRICFDFSPQGEYMSAIRYAEDRVNHLILFDKSLNIASEISNVDMNGDYLVAGCPTWSDNGREVYFVTISNSDYSAHIFLYSLEEDEILYRQSFDDIAPPLQLSPNGSHIAFGGFTNGYQVNIIFPDGQIYPISNQFEFANYPLWRPSASVNDR